MSTAPAGWEPILFFYFFDDDVDLYVYYSRDLGYIRLRTRRSMDRRTMLVNTKCRAVLLILHPLPLVVSSWRWRGTHILLHVYHESCHAWRWMLER